LRSPGPSAEGPQAAGMPRMLPVLAGPAVHSGGGEEEGYQGEERSPLSSHSVLPLWLTARSKQGPSRRLISIGIGNAHPSVLGRLMQEGSPASSASVGGGDPGRRRRRRRRSQSFAQGRVPRQPANALDPTELQTKVIAINRRRGKEKARLRSFLRIGIPPSPRSRRHQRRHPNLERLLALGRHTKGKRSNGGASEPEAPKASHLNGSLGRGQRGAILVGEQGAAQLAGEASGQPRQ